MLVSNGFSGVPELLRPQLEHNRLEWYRLQRRKRQTAVAGVVLFLPAMILAPSSLRGEVIIGLLGLMFVVFGYVEVGRMLVFRRDLRERQEGGLPLTALDRTPEAPTTPLPPRAE